MTSAFLLLPAVVKVTFIFTFTRANIIDGKQKFTHNFALWVFMGVYGCLWISGCLWMYMGVYGYL